MGRHALDCSSLTVVTSASITATASSSLADADSRSAAAFGVVVLAASVAALGSSAVFYPAVARFATSRILAASLGFATGVMLYVSLVDIYTKAIEGFEGHGHSADHAFIFTTLCFFAGIVFMKFIDLIIRRFTRQGESDDKMETSTGGMMEEIVARNEELLLENQANDDSVEPPPPQSDYSTTTTTTSGRTKKNQKKLELQHHDPAAGSSKEKNRKGMYYAETENFNAQDHRNDVFFECQSDWLVASDDNDDDEEAGRRDRTVSSYSSNGSSNRNQPSGQSVPDEFLLRSPLVLPQQHRMAPKLPPVHQVLEMVEHGFINTTTTTSTAKTTSSTEPIEGVSIRWGEGVGGVGDDNPTSQRSGTSFNHHNSNDSTTTATTSTIDASRRNLHHPPQQQKEQEQQEPHCHSHQRHHHKLQQQQQQAPEHNRPKNGSGESGAAASADLVSMGAATATAIALHNFPEGLVTFVAYVENPAVGIALAISIAIHNIPEGLCVAMAIFYGTGNRWKGFVWGTLCCFTSEPAGALFAWVILRNNVFSGDTYGILYGMVAGMMVFICLDELLPMAFQFDPRGTIVTWTCLAGMTLVAITLMLFKSAF